VPVVRPLGIGISTGNRIHERIGAADDETRMGLSRALALMLGLVGVYGICRRRFREGGEMSIGLS
jgi:hypothetical protein